ncbi:hypothetical protein KAU33_10395 [Candidatus Dependentiae bacterium]|nr:hypothetical protein [Candidatus Dependentiae bacterium]
MKKEMKNIMKKNYFRNKHYKFISMLLFFNSIFIILIVFINDLNVISLIRFIFGIFVTLMFGIILLRIIKLQILLRYAIEDEIPNSYDIIKKTFPLSEFSYVNFKYLRKYINSSKEEFFDTITILNKLKSEMLFLLVYSIFEFLILCVFLNI